MLRFCVEYAKSRRSQCRACKRSIAHQSLRVGAHVQSMHYDGIETRWFHPCCFNIEQPDRKDRPVPTSTVDFDNFDNIRWEDQQTLMCIIGEIDAGHEENRPKGAPPDDAIKDAEPSREKTGNHFEESEIKKQNKMIFDMKDKLANMSRCTFVLLLKIVSGCTDKQSRRRTDANLCLVADAMVFGLLRPCKKCSGKYEYVSGQGYRCTGNFTEWTRCEEVTQDPGRDKFIVPNILRNNVPFLRSYKSQVRKRIVQVRALSTSNSNFAPNLNVSVQSSSIGQFPTRMTIGSEKLAKQTLSVTKSGAVDPKSKLTEVAHIYEHGNDSFTAILAKTCIQANKNSYYKLQILEHDHLNKYWLFRQWGRIGMNIGNTRCEPLPLDTCIEKFEKYYFKQAGNKWSERGNFVKRVGKMFPVDTDHGEIICLRSNVESKLEPCVQDLIKLIFNIDTMTRVTLQYEVDFDKMPLGNLSSAQLFAADRVLTMLSNEMQKTIADDNRSLKLKDATNQFYTLVPHSFGLSNAPLFETQGDIEEKRNMVYDLLGTQLANKLWRLNIDSNEPKNFLDVKYERLNTHIAVLDKTSEMYGIVAQYVRASTYNNQDLEIEEVFVVKRAGDEERYEPFRKWANRKLLWHGSRAVNFPGILTQGLRITPPDAPPTGYMFGKGIYFADRVGKSAHYCYADSNNLSGVILLCEVALGSVYELDHAEYIEQLPEGKDSTIGFGMRRPDPTESHVTRDGVEVPCGRSILASGKGPWSLEFNEYVVYNPLQIKAKYLVKLRFKHLM